MNIPGKANLVVVPGADWAPDIYLLDPATREPIPLPGTPDATFKVNGISLPVTIETDHQQENWLRPRVTATDTAAITAGDKVTWDLWFTVDGEPLPWTYGNVAVVATR